MYNVFFYRDENGKSPIADYIQELSNKGNKDSRVKLNKIYEYIQYLSEAGQQAGEPYVKHLEGDIWELRPIRDRILFAAWDGQSFILLHHFTKKTQKTPKRQIEQAKRNLADHRKRSKKNEKR
ncbi:MAG: type II toxin-antitoxin system RelE/ParE family toxin [Symbiobacteriaceae bacterium]|nr:type II toxin-antitoxin system RelE/ParE family toxin [Symbiobacteriaceae bacterium]